MILTMVHPLLAGLIGYSLGSMNSPVTVPDYHARDMQLVVALRELQQQMRHPQYTSTNVTGLPRNEIDDAYEEGFHDGASQMGETYADLLDQFIDAILT